MHSILKRFLARALLLALTLAWPALTFAQNLAPAPVHGWYIQIQPIPNGPTALIGPWAWYAAAADFDGSMLYSHPFQCHLTGNPADCRVTGNGMAYTRGTPYPPAHQIPSSGPVKLPWGTIPRQYGWYRLYYSNDGTPTVFPKAQNAKYRALVLSGQGVFPRYLNVNCPGWPFFFVGSGVGQPDQVCN